MQLIVDRSVNCSSSAGVVSHCQDAPEPRDGLVRRVVETETVMLDRSQSMRCYGTERNDDGWVDDNDLLEEPVLTVANLSPCRGPIIARSVQWIT